MTTIATTATKPITKKQARDLTECIKSAAALTWDLIVKAYNERAWSALGYGSWDDYCDTELSGTRLRLPREERSEVVSSLRDSGMSLRAIQSATGVSRPTIIKDLADAQVVKSLPPEPPGGVTESTPGQTDRVAAALAAAQAKQDLAPVEPIAVPEKITGTDGKTYKKKPVKKEPVVVPPSPIGEEEAMRAAARIAELSAWGKACDGLLAALSFAASSVPPDETGRYPAVATFVERYAALGDHISTWNGDAEDLSTTVERSGAEPDPLAEHQATPEMTGWWLHFNSRWHGSPGIHIEYRDSESVDYKSGELPAAITPGDARYLAAALQDRLADIEGIIAKLERRAGESR